MSAGSSTPRTPRSVRSTLQRAVFGAADSSLLSLESLPLTEGGFRPRPSYGSIFSYYHMLRRGSVLGSNKVLWQSLSVGHVLILGFTQCGLTTPPPPM
ncbi:hypothetical protein J6590_067725 [Homalodisca vitripennis]|nr:hypothetical protein J6590_067725 [Homalodisca vitripennis]